jgi:hypothetical protein
MSQNQSRVSTVIAAVASARHLAQLDPQDEAVGRTIGGLEEQIALLKTKVDKPAGEKNSFNAYSRKQDIDALGGQIDKLRSAALIPAANYQRIVQILSGLKEAHIASQRPENAEVRPRIAEVTEKLAGIFAEVDTVADLDKPLEQIEKAVHQLYGDQSKNGTFYINRRGKGHHGYKTV